MNLFSHSAETYTQVEDNPCLLLEGQKKFTFFFLSFDGKCGIISHHKRVLHTCGVILELYVSLSHFIYDWSRFVFEDIDLLYHPVYEAVSKIPLVASCSGQDSGQKVRCLRRLSFHC